MYQFLSAIILLLILSQCATHSAAWNTGRTDSLAENQIMLVLEKPESLGWKRLQYATELHPEFAFFLEKIGKPDCIAETTQGDRHYMICYQLEQRRAFSCRSILDRPSIPMQVSGPYPMSHKEYSTLRGLKKRAESEMRTKSASE